MKVLGDGWTAVTQDGSLSAHFEAHGRGYGGRAVDSDRARSGGAGAQMSARNR